MLIPRLLYITTAVVWCAAASCLDHPVDLYARQDEVGEVTVSTITPESVETSTLEGSTTEVAVQGVTSSWTFGTDNSDTSTVPIDSSTTVETVGGSSIDTTYGATTSIFTVKQGETTQVILSEITTTVILSAISTVVSIPSLSIVVSISNLVTNLSIGDTSTVVIFDGVTTTVTVTGTTSAVTITGSPSTVVIPAVTSLVQIESTTTTVSIPSTSTTVSEGEVAEESSVYSLSYVSTVPVTLKYAASSIVSLTRTATRVEVSLESTEVVLSVTATTVTVTGTASTTEITVSAVVTTITLSEISSSISISESETTTSVGESTDTGETSEGTNTTEIDTTSSTSSSSSPSSSFSSPSSADITTSSTTNPTYCEVTRNTLTPEEEVQLAVLFGDSSGGTTFADYVVSYASRLVAQIADVANIAVGDNNYAFTTAFDTIDVPGVLGLASAAPIYTCFLSTLWAQALANPQQYAKRVVPSEDEKIKLIVLFEKRATDGMQFDYAELLVDDTNSLISDVQSVAGAAGAAAVGGDLSAYASLFANVDVAQFLSIATEAPIYTEALSSAFVTALESYSQAVNAPTTVVMTTNTYTTVSTIVTNVVNGTLTVPTTYHSTIVRTSVGPVNTERGTRTSHTTETRMEVTSETVSEIVRESTLPNGQVIRVTETVVAGAPADVFTRTGERETVEVVTNAGGRVETRTVTVGALGTATAPVASGATHVVTTARPNVVYYTQVQSGRTYIHTVEIQHTNNALKGAVAVGVGLLGAVILLL